MGFLDQIKAAASTVVDEWQDIRGQKPKTPTKPKKTTPYVAPPSTPSTPKTETKTKTVVKERPYYVEAPPQTTVREVLQPPIEPKVSYRQDTSQWMTPEYEQAKEDYQVAHQDYIQHPTYKTGVEDITRQIEDERVAVEQILAQAHSSYEKMKDVSQFKGYWEDKSTGNKVMAAIGLLFGAMGQGMHGKKNVALEILLKNIDRDSEIKEKRIINQMRKITHSKVGAQLKQAKIEKLNQQLNDLSLGKPYAVAAAQAAALAQKTGNPKHAEAANFMELAFVQKNLSDKANDLKKLKEETLVRNYAEQEQAPRSTLTTETVTGRTVPVPRGRRAGGGDKPLTKVQSYNQQRGLRKDALAGANGKAFDYASNFERFRIKLKAMINSKNPYDHYNVLLEAAKMLQGDNSVVREPEMRAFASSTNLANVLKNAVDGWTDGIKFQRQQMQDLYNTIKSGAAVSAVQYKKMISPILEHADSLGVPHESVYSANAMYMTDDEVRKEYNKRKGLK